MTGGPSRRERYRRYLSSPHWRQFRKHARKELPYKCPCGSAERLELHHLTYERLGRERLEDVAWLCRDCHFELHGGDAEGAFFEAVRAQRFARSRPDQSIEKILSDAERRARRGDPPPKPDAADRLAEWERRHPGTQGVVPS